MVGGGVWLGVAMRLGMVSTAAGEPSMAVGREGAWVPLLTVPGADQLGPASSDLLTFLGAGEEVHRLAEELDLAATPPGPSLLTAQPGAQSRCGIDALRRDAGRS